MRALTRLIIDQPPDVLPEFLYKALKLSPELLSAVKSDEIWGKSSQLQSPVFLIATSSLSDAVAQSPGLSPHNNYYSPFFFEWLVWCRCKCAIRRRHHCISRLAGEVFRSEKGARSLFVAHFKMPFVSLQDSSYCSLWIVQVTNRSFFDSDDE